MTRFKKEEMNHISKVIQAQLRKTQTLPSYVNMKEMDKGKTIKLDKKQYAGLFEAQNVYWLKHNRQPNYTTLNSTANNPLVLDYQNNKYNCCPSSLSMASQMLYDYKTESYLSKQLGTNTNGTSPKQLIGGAKQCGFKVTRINRSIGSVKNALILNKPVIMHIQTKTANCLNYKNDYGHYILCYDTTGDYYKLADPTKGLKTCKANMIDNATNGRDIGYYAVELA